MAGSMGPNSFALNPDGSVVVQNPVNNTSGVQTTLTGGPSSATPNAPGARIAPTDWNGVMSSSFQTLDAINKLAGNVLKPYVEAEEKKAYFEGAARVAQGQSLQQIENDQPWFTKIFGPSATVRGAQAMAATTALTQAESQTLEDMQDLKQKSPDEFRSYLVSQAASIKATGDPLVDATVQAKLAEQWGPLMKTHMREHIAWQQADMLEKQVNLNVSQAAALASKRKANSTGWSDEDRAMAYRDAVIAAQPAAGQPKQSWSKGMVRSLKGALNGGYFDYYNAIKASPLWNEIDADAREALEAAVPQYVMKDARNNPAITNITNDLGALEFNLTHGASGITRPEELHSVIDEYNARHRKETGSEEPLINNTKRAQMLKEWMTGQLIAHTQYKQASTADRTAMQDVINKADPGTLRAIMPFIGGKGALTGWELTPEVKKNLADEYASEAAQFARSYNLPMEQAAQIVLNKRLANADLVPGAIIQANNTVQGDVSLNSAVARVLRSKAAASQSTTVAVPVGRCPISARRNVPRFGGAFSCRSAMLDEAERWLNALPFTQLCANTAIEQGRISSTRGGV